MRSLIFLCFFGMAALAYAAEDPEGLPKELAEIPTSDPSKGPWTWEEIDGKKFKVFIKKTRDHIIKYIRLKKCGCRVQTTRKTWVGPHKKLWYDDKHAHGHHGHHGHGHHGHNHGPHCGCKNCGHSHNGHHGNHGHHGHGHH